MLNIFESPRRLQIQNVDWSMLVSFYESKIKILKHLIH